MTPPDSRRIRLVSDAVVASYIHDISARTGSGAIPEPARRRRDRLTRETATPRRRQLLRQRGLADSSLTAENRHVRSAIMRGRRDGPAGRPATQRSRMATNAERSNG